MMLMKRLGSKTTHHMHPLNSLQNNTPAPVYILHSPDCSTSIGLVYWTPEQTDQQSSSCTAPRIPPPLVLKIVGFSLNDYFDPSAATNAVRFREQQVRNNCKDPSIRSSPDTP